MENNKSINNDDDDWEDEKITKHQETDSVIENLTKRNVKTLVHELKRQNAFSDLFKSRKRGVDNNKTESEASCSKAKRVLRAREPSKNEITVRDLPLLEEDNESDNEFNPDEEEEEDSSNSMSDDETGNMTDNTATDCSAPNTPLNLNLEPVRTRARDSTTNKKPMSELLLESEQVLSKIDPDNNPFYDLMNINTGMDSRLSPSFSLDDLDEKYKNTNFESMSSSSPSRMITSELKRLTPKAGTMAGSTTSYENNTLMQALTPADKLWTEFCSETFYLDDDVLKNTVDQQDTEILDPSFDYLTEQEKEAKRTETLQDKEEENRSYRIKRNEAVMATYGHNLYIITYKLTYES